MRIIFKNRRFTTVSADSGICTIVVTTSHPKKMSRQTTRMARKAKTMTRDAHIVYDFEMDIKRVTYEIKPIKINIT